MEGNSGGCASSDRGGNGSVGDADTASFDQQIKNMDQVDIFEDFVSLLSRLSKKGAPLMVNSFYIIDDEKQRGKMTVEFYAAVKGEDENSSPAFLL